MNPFFGRALQEGATVCRKHGGSRRRLSEAMGLQKVVGESEPEQDAVDFFLSAHGQLSEVPLSQPGVDAFDEGAAFVAGFSGGAVHAPTPGGDAGSVVGARRKRIAAMLAAGRRAMHGGGLLRRPLDVAVVGEAARGESA